MHSTVSKSSTANRLAWLSGERLMILMPRGPDGLLTTVRRLTETQGGNYLLNTYLQLEPDNQSRNCNLKPNSALSTIH